MTPPTTRVLVISSAAGLDLAGELMSILGRGCEVVPVRAGNRQAVEMALDGRDQYQIVHVIAHGTESILQFGAELMAEAEFAGLMETQRELRFVVLSACDSYEVGGAVHNSAHAPVVSYNAPVSDTAAVDFARVFYQSWRRDPDIHRAVEQGRAALAVLHPEEARKVRLLNGDMITPGEFAAYMGRIETTLGVMGGQLVNIEGRLDKIEGVPQAWFFVGLALAVLLIAAQVATPFVAESLAHLP